MEPKLKYLVGVPSPRNIDVVTEGHESIRDKYHIPFLYAKYWKEIQAYMIIQDFFLNHSNADYLILSPDDLVVNAEHFEQLVETVEKENYPVFSGMCNLDCIHPTLMNICIDIAPNVFRKLRRYYWVHSTEIPQGILKVKFSGFPFMFIHRSVVERIPLTGDSPHDVNRRGIEPTSFDTAFCWECDQKGIPIYVDTRVNMLHLRYAKHDTVTGSQVDNIRVYKSAPHVFYNKEDGIIDDWTDHYMNYIWEKNPYNCRVYLQRFKH